IRFHTFIPITLDRDEATYAVFADHLLSGSELYKDIQDIKPPGIFFIYCGIQLLFGKSILAIRLMSILVVSSAAFFLYCFKRNQGFDPISSLLTGLIYMLMFNYFFGLSGNTELYFTWFFSLGLLLFQSAKNAGGYFFSGLIIGFGFIVKQHIAFDFAALGLFFLISLVKEQKFRKKFWSMTLMVIGFILPYFFVHLYFYFNGNWDYYYYVTYVAPNNYSSSHEVLAILKFNFIAMALYLPFIVMGVLAWRQSHLNFSFKLLIVLLLTFDLLAVNLTGKPFKHYLLQLAIPISLVAGEAFQISFFKRLFTKQSIQRLVIGLTLFYAVTMGVIYRYFRFDTAKELVHFFEDRMKPEDTLYAADSPTILYWYYDKRSPTKYVHSTLMVFPHHIEELGIDIEAELNKIFSQRPTYVILSDRYPHTWFVDRVKSNYALIGDLEKFNVYQSIQ
ncbi:MAG: glycosyltransferase family 39 protein, partial [Bacteroidota bacterium]